MWFIVYKVLGIAYVNHYKRDGKENKVPPKSKRKIKSYKSQAITLIKNKGIPLKTGKTDPQKEAEKYTFSHELHKSLNFS